MRALTMLGLAAAAAQARPAPAPAPASAPAHADANLHARTTTASAAAPVTIFLCGDSTMAPGGGGGPTQGWGEYLHYSFDPARAVVSNRAIAGRSARSYTREGRFDAVAKDVKNGDWVVIEFGHNDGGSLSSSDNGRTDCFGDGNQTCPSTYNGVREIVQTYPTYIKNATSQFLAKGAKVIISSATPDNVWETGKFTWSTGRFDYYPWLSASQEGGPAKGAYFVPHGAYAAQAMQNLGAKTVNANYPKDHTHTAPFLADIMARSFVLGVKCGTSGLADLVLNSTASLTGQPLGDCIAHNSSLPVRELASERAAVLE